MKHLNTLSLAVALSLMTSCSNGTYEEKTPAIEIMLADELDDTRGYCLDIAGGKGAIEKGLQANNVIVSLVGSW